MHPGTARTPRKRLYTEAERARRDSTRWTLVQGLLAPAQFVVFAVSVVLVLRFLMTGDGYTAATISILIKTGFLYVIMVTGAIWEKVVFGQYLFAPAFFWEDVFSFAVIALHTAYLWALWTGALTPTELMFLALAAYATYVINAGQFLWKLRMARLDAEAEAIEENRTMAEVVA
ncbi:MAG: 2-vinyl bacteriochlorophyllide hydratase [Rhodobacteraceae bacterium]|jgi:3-vinyl bacteriochlorophyllide hydratase|nr:2-vinyl bacteriochlorophyllide hydratase [Paracoccaceae bacterium]MCZ8153558.1 2-vinyl bacteriochlorophyllide hydratase [Paracoccaceae bacterium]MCZ8335675.1 2-vinyl bacteriochlorophyllide hydratase [Paracoccaceae bacterium]